jgi:hypothetical protein
MIWPTPYAMTTTLALGSANGSQIVLPVVPAHGALPAPVFRAPEREPQAVRAHESAALNVSSNVSGQEWITRRDPAKQQGTVEWHGGDVKDYPWGSEEVREEMLFRADDLHPEQSSVHGDTVMTVSLKDRQLEWRTLTDTRSDLQNFYIEVTRELHENGKLIRRKQWQSTIARDGQ